MAYGCAEEPGSGWDLWASVEEMKHRGVAWLPFEEDAIADLAQIFRNLPDIEELFEDSTEGSIGCEAPSAGGPARFILNKSKISENMRWLWAYDEDTLARFDEFVSKANLLSVLGNVDGRADDLMLYSASFIIVKGSKLEDSETLQHLDMGHRRIPRGSSFTCLTSLTELPGSVGGLQFWPWNCHVAEHQSEWYYCDATRNAAPQVHKYRPGKLVAFDGRLRHRTEPFEYDRSLVGADSEALATCDAYEAGGHIRVLASFAFASSDARLARYNHKMLRKQCHDLALIRQSPKLEVDDDSELDTSDDESEPKTVPPLAAALESAAAERAANLFAEDTAQAALVRQ